MVPPTTRCVYRRGDGRVVIFFVESNDGQAFPDLVEEEQCLVACHPLSSGHAGKAGVNLREAVGGTAGVLFVGLQISSRAGPVVLMLEQEWLRSGLRYQRRPSLLVLPEDVAVALGAHPANGLIYGFSRERNAGTRVEDPHSLLLVHATLTGRGAQHDVVFGAFEFQGIAGADLQGVAHRLGQDDAARFVDGQSGIHNGILP